MLYIVISIICFGLNFSPPAANLSNSTADYLNVKIERRNCEWKSNQTAGMSQCFVMMSGVDTLIDKGSPDGTLYSSKGK